jgi:hypothetical protein
VLGGGDAMQEERISALEQSLKLQENPTDAGL